MSIQIKRKSSAKYLSAIPSGQSGQTKPPDAQVIPAEVGLRSECAWRFVSLTAKVSDQNHTLSLESCRSPRLGLALVLKSSANESNSHIYRKPAINRVTSTQLASHAKKQKKDQQALIFKDKTQYLPLHLPDILSLLRNKPSKTKS